MISHVKYVWKSCTFICFNIFLILIGKYVYRVSHTISLGGDFYLLTSVFALQIRWAWSPAWPLRVRCWVCHMEPRLPAVWRGGAHRGAVWWREVFSLAYGLAWGRGKARYCSRKTSFSHNLKVFKYWKIYSHSFFYTHSFWYYLDSTQWIGKTGVFAFWEDLRIVYI